MIWLTWRQFRTRPPWWRRSVSAFAILLLVTGPHLVTLYRDSALAACRSNCGAGRQQLPELAVPAPRPTTWSTSSGRC